MYFAGSWSLQDCVPSPPLSMLLVGSHWGWGGACVDWPLRCRRRRSLSTTSGRFIHVDAVSRQVRVACLERHGAGGMLIPTGVLVVACQTIPHLDDREQAAHRDIVAERSGGALH